MSLIPKLSSKFSISNLTLSKNFSTMAEDAGWLGPVSGNLKLNDNEVSNDVLGNGKWQMD